MKLLFCGLGSIGQRHLRNVRTLLGDSVEVLAWRSRGTSPVLNADMTVRAGAELEQTYNLRSFAKLEAALAEKPDAVFITNPNTLHLPVALAAAKAGCHLFVEKPISHSMDGMAELIAEVEHRRLTALVAYQFRFHPGLQKVKACLTQGGLGKLAAAQVVNAEYLPDWHRYEDYRGTHPARRELGGGCLRIQTHELDYVLWLFGLPKKVFAVGGHLSGLEVNVEDSVGLLLEYPRPGGGALPVYVHLDYLQRPPQRSCEIVGDAGRLRYDYYANQIEFHELAQPAPRIERFDGFKRENMFLDELRHFFACIEGREQPVVDLREGCRSMAIAAAASRSLESGRAELVEEFLPHRQ
ncbi:MAG TPA: Gfo/Idh/MocA family oxidoreductase [Opitutales bacterium]|nr:Gfo/Idh/MocA family oxidoreductase [Opitutales bacterium]